MKNFTAVLVAAALAIHNVANAQNTMTTTPVETSVVSAGNGTISDNNGEMGMGEFNNMEMTMDKEGNETQDGSLMDAGYESSESGSGNRTTTVGDESGSGISGAVKFQSVPLVMSTVAAGLAVVLF